MSKNSNLLGVFVAFIYVNLLSKVYFDLLSFLNSVVDKGYELNCVRFAPWWTLLNCAGTRTLTSKVYFLHPFLYSLCNLFLRKFFDVDAYSRYKICLKTLF